MAKKNESTPPARGRGKPPIGLAHVPAKEKKALASRRAAERVLALRTAKGMTQQDLATGAELGMDTVRRFERGEGQIGVDNLDRVAKTLGVPLSELVA